MTSPEFESPDDQLPDNEAAQQRQLPGIIYAASVILRNTFNLGKDFFRCRSLEDIQNVLEPPDYRL